jgi:thioredoxin 1
VPSNTLPKADACLVACLCAAWCRSCEEYREVFDALAREHQGAAHFVWVDIEDQEEALGPLDIVDFPTLLIAQENAVLFFGPVIPRPQVVRQLLMRALRGELAARDEPALTGLPARVARLPGRSHAA